MKKFFQVFFLLVNLSVLAQKVANNYPDFKNKTFNEVLENKNWKVLNKTEGLLNFNEVKDLVVVLRSKDSIYESRLDEKPRKNIIRIILVLIDNKVIVQNNKFIAREDEGGMSPRIYPEIEVINNELSIYWEYTRSNINYIFKFFENDLKLTDVKQMYVHGATGNYEYLHYKFIDEILVIKSGNISKDAETIKEIPIILKAGLKKLSEINEMYEWEVIKNRFI